MTKFNKLITGFCLGLLVLLTIAASIDYRALNVTQFSAVSTVSIISGAPLTNSFLKDLTGVLSVGPTARALYDGGGTTISLNWDTRLLKDASGVNSLSYASRILVDATGTTSINWDTRTFTGSSWVFLSITNHSDVSAGAFATGNIWGYDGLTAKWTNGPPAASSGGTVTSVSETVPGQFQVTGSPVTTSGTFAITLTNATGVSNSPIVLKTNATVSGLTKTGFTTNNNPTASSLMMVDANKVETNAVVGAGLLLSGGVLLVTGGAGGGTVSNAVALTLNDPLIGQGNGGAASTNKTAFLQLFGNGGLVKLATNDASSLTNFALLTNGITASFDGGGAVIQTNITRYLSVPQDCTITGFTMLSDASTVSVVEVMRCTYTEFDAGATHPVVGDKITASLPPTIGPSLYKTNVTSVGTWSASLTNKNILAFRTISNSAATTLSLTLFVTHVLQ